MSKSRVGYYSASILFVIFLVEIVSADSRESGDQLVELRIEVDDLENKLTQMKMDARAERLSLNQQKLDLESLLSQERVRNDMLVAMRKKRLDQQRMANKEMSQLITPCLEAANQFRQVINDSLPFKKEERLAEIDLIISKLIGAAQDPVVACSRLWQLIEDELTLTSQIGLHRQVIELEGKKLVAEVARLGMAVLYFRLEQGELGWTTRDSTGQYEFSLIEQNDYLNDISILFDALGRQERSGYFVLPVSCVSKIRDLCRHD